MDFDQMIKLIETVSKSGLTAFELKEGNLEISMKAKSAHESQAEQIRTAAVNEPVGDEESERSGEQEGNIVKSPLVGTFYSAASPEDEPFVKVGDRVSKGQVLGIIEAMKLMNEIESEFDGTVKEILTENQEMVEYGQPLFVIG